MNSCEARLQDLFGGGGVSEVAVVQVAAVWRAAGGAFHAIRIGPRSPKSESDLFSLGAARARSDVILTSGQILRDEPDLEHGFAGPAAAKLAAWRRERLGRRDLPRSAVLSSGRDLDFDHPLFTGVRPALVLTGPAGAERVASQAAARDIEIVVRADPGPRDAVAWSREQGRQTLLIELGPSSARGLYEPPGLVDELLLSVFEGPLAPDLVGGELGTHGTLEAAIGAAGPVSERLEESGRWSFVRYRRDVV